MKIWLKWLIILFFLFAIMTMHFLFTSLHISETDLDIEIEAGSSLKKIAFQLVDEKILSEPWRFILLAKALGQSTKLIPGNYLLTPDITPYQLLNYLIEGRAKEGSITFIEGQNLQAMIENIKSNDRLKKTLKSYNSKAIAKAIGIPYDSAEGQFFPDTYYFHKNATDIEIFKMAYKAMQNKLKYEWELREEGLPYKNMYEALIMASIIEKEMGNTLEANLIAGVFIHRLSINMKLQSDPTVIYGIGENFDGDIKKKDLLADTPYNTYTRQGMPPGPITMPSLISIRAALHPIKTDLLYFVGKGDGTHYFSKSLIEHNDAVREYQIK